MSEGVLVGVSEDVVLCRSEDVSATIVPNYLSRRFLSVRPYPPKPPTSSPPPSSSLLSVKNPGQLDRLISIYGREEEGRRRGEREREGGKKREGGGERGRGGGKRERRKVDEG